MTCRSTFLTGGKALSVTAILWFVPAQVQPQTAPPPSPWWWFTRGAISFTGANDFAAINQGQLKTFARAARLELDLRLSSTGGAGVDVSDLIDAWDQAPGPPLRSDYAAVNIGQLKSVAKPFYDRLITVGLASAYPWTAEVGDDQDFAMANIGQVKSAFGFDFFTDSDDDGLDDFWELHFFEHLGFGGDFDYDLDGSNNGQEYLARTNPADSFNGRVPTVQIVSGDAQEAYPDTIFPEPLVVRVVDSAGLPIANAPVAIGRTPDTLPCVILNSPQRDDEAGLKRTDADGRVTVWLLGPRIVDAPLVIDARAGSGSVLAVATFHARTQNLAAPIAPSGLRLSVNGAGNDVLTWEDNSDTEDSFIVERLNPDGTWTAIGFLPPNTTTFTVPR